MSDTEHAALAALNLADRCLTAISQILTVHSNQDGYCEECVTSYPCSTVRLVEEAMTDHETGDP